MNLTPSTVAIGDVYFPPLLLASFLGLFLASLTGRLLNRCRLSRFIFYPPLALVALAAIYTVILGTFVIPS